ncbi:MAG TPA: hypothetical protein DD001_22095, partial [Microcoleaceae bacterium UBA10368]|nr:hypothetical protein [Microcoleaceae cyanobacterium UBA10368]
PQQSGGCEGDRDSTTSDIYYAFQPVVDTNPGEAAPKIQVKCTRACLAIDNWRSAIGNNYYYASL